MEHDLLCSQALRLIANCTYLDSVRFLGKFCFISTSSYTLYYIY